MCELSLDPDGAGVGVVMAGGLGRCYVSLTRQCHRAKVPGDGGAEFLGVVNY